MRLSVRVVTAVFGLACVAALVAVRPATAQVAGQNVNMVSGTKWPNGDPRASHYHPYIIGRHVVPRGRCLGARHQPRQHRLALFWRRTRCVRVGHRHLRSDLWHSKRPTLRC